MNKQKFVQRVQEAVNVPTPEMAEQCAQIVFSLLCHRLTENEAKDVEAQLPQDMKKLWHSDTWMTNFISISKNWQLKYRRKAELYSLVENELEKRQIPIGAEQLTLAVFHILKEQISPGEVEEVAAQLPEEIEQVWKAA